MIHVRMISCIHNDWSTLFTQGTKQEKESDDPTSPVVVIGWTLNGQRVVTESETDQIPRVILRLKHQTQGAHEEKETDKIIIDVNRIVHSD